MAITSYSENMDSFDAAIGGELVSALIAETRIDQFKMACLIVIPKWMVLLQHRLDSMGQWPFDGPQTKCLAFALRGWRFPSLESHISEFLESRDVQFTLAAVCYCDNVHIYRTEAIRASKWLLANLPSDLEAMHRLAFGSGLLNQRELRQFLNRVIRNLT